MEQLHICGRVTLRMRSDGKPAGKVSFSLPTDSDNLSEQEQQQKKKLFEEKKKLLRENEKKKIKGIKKTGLVEWALEVQNDRKRSLPLNSPREEVDKLNISINLLKSFSAEKKYLSEEAKRIKTLNEELQHRNDILADTLKATSPKKIQKNRNFRVENEQAESPENGYSCADTMRTKSKDLSNNEDDCAVLQSSEELENDEELIFSEGGSPVVILRLDASGPPIHIKNRTEKSLSQSLIDESDRPRVKVPPLELHRLDSHQLTGMNYEIMNDWDATKTQTLEHHFKSSPEEHRKQPHANNTSDLNNRSNKYKIKVKRKFSDNENTNTNNHPMWSTELNKTNHNNKRKTRCTSTKQSQSTEQSNNKNRTKVKQLHTLLHENYKTVNKLKAKQSIQTTMDLELPTITERDSNSTVKMNIILGLVWLVLVAFIMVELMFWK